MARFNDGAAMTNVVSCTRAYLDSILAEERLIDAIQLPPYSVRNGGNSFFPKGAAA